MVTDPEFDPPAASSSPVVKSDEAVPLHRAVLGAWGYLLRSRETLLRDAYLTSAAEAGLKPDPATSADLARSRYLDALRHHAAPQPDLAALERRIVYGTRITAAWTVAWSTLIPLSLVASVCVYIARIGSTPGTVAAFGVFGLIVAFPVLSVVGLMAQAVLLGPFNAALLWWLGAPGSPTDGPGRL